MRRWAPIGGVIAAASSLALAAAGVGSSAPTDVASCKRVPRHVIVNLDDDQHHNVIDHAFDARRAGHPRVLHIRREKVWVNRRKALKNIPKKKGYDRNAYPPARTDEGGDGASVRYIRRRENRSAAALMGRQLAPYCAGQSFVFER